MSSPQFTLVIGNKRYSSWSLRPWVLLKYFEIPFEEVLIPMDQSSTDAEIARFSPAGKLPILIDHSVQGGLAVWESLAIAEYLNDCFPEKGMWPKDLVARARARTISNEMHAGFATMRELMPHDLQRVRPGFDGSVAREDTDRVQSIWKECLMARGGPFLFGSFSIADAMYAPVVNRFVTYDVRCDGLIGAYIKTMRELPAHRAWIEAGERETLRMPCYE